MTRRTARLAAWVAGVVVLAPALAEQTRTATLPAGVLRDGTAHGIATTSRGRLQLAPLLTPATRPLPNGDPSQVYSVAVDASGNVLLGTGPDGQVLRATAGGETSEIFRAPEPLVTALLVLPGGDLLAATAPGGKIYRIGADGRARVWCSTEERYVWAMARGEGDLVLAATGDRGRLLKIDRSGTATVLFDADETHLVSLAPGPSGTTWAGSASRGLVYRVDAAGRGTVVYDDDLPEAKSIAVQADGSLIVAFDAAPAPDKRPPAVRIRVGGGGAAGEGMGEIDTREASSMQGVIEGLGPSSSDDGDRLRGKVVRIGTDGSERELWRSSEEAPFGCALDGEGRTLFVTGEPARLWRVEGPEEIALLATLKESQATALARDARGLVLATSNPAAAYRVDGKRADSGTYVSPMLDAGGIARWGSLSWRDEGAGGRVEIHTRTGNSSEPDGTWSAWKGPSADPAGSNLGAEGRYLQWRARVTASSAAGPRISGVTATYATRNRVPSIRDLRTEPSAGAVSSKATLRWSAADADGDGVTVEVEARRQGTAEWKSAARSDPPAAKSGESIGDGFFKDGRATWDTTTWDEGRYDVRAVATDQAGNPPGEGLSTTVDFDVVVRVDRTPPEVRAQRVAGGGVEIEVLDDVSGVARLEIVEESRVVAAIRPEDGVSDGAREMYRLGSADAGSAGARSIRATDAAGNAAETKVPSP